MRLRVRLAAYFFLVIAVVAGTTLIFMRQRTESLFRSFVFSGDFEKAKVYATILGEYYGEQQSWQDLQTFATNALFSDRIAVADNNGVIVADNSGELVRTIHPAKHLSHGVPILANSKNVGTVLVGSMVDSSLSGINERFLESIIAALLWAVLISAGIALILGLLLSTQLTGPVVALTRAVRRVAAGDLSAAVTTKGKNREKDEITELSESFNVMTEELKRLEDAKKRIIADSAHELRTPVTLIQGTIEAMMDGVYPLDIDTLQSVHEETIRLSRLIDMLRELELIESGKLDLHLERIDCRELANKAITQFTAAAKEKRIFLDLAPGNDLPSVNADALRLEEVLYNLISNAIKYTPAGGKVLLALRNDAAKGVVHISVDDSGPGIPLEERERIFERYYRMEKSRSTNLGGRGLGLAIAREITKAHGGTLAVRASDFGGASFVLTLKSAD